MTPTKVEEALAALRCAVEGLSYRGKSANATDEDNMRDEVYTELDPYVTELEVELATLTAALAESERDAARWRFYADTPQTALMLGSELDPNNPADWKSECDRIADAAMKDTNHDR